MVFDVACGLYAKKGNTYVNIRHLGYVDDTGSVTAEKGGTCPHKFLHGRSMLS